MGCISAHVPTDKAQSYCQLIVLQIIYNAALQLLETFITMLRSSVHPPFSHNQRIAYSFNKQQATVAAQSTISNLSPTSKIGADGCEEFMSKPGQICPRCRSLRESMEHPSLEYFMGIEGKDMEDCCYCAIVARLLRKIQLVEQSSIKEFQIFFRSGAGTFLQIDLNDGSHHEYEFFRTEGDRSPRF
jgi:hypothetical protein